MDAVLIGWAKVAKGWKGAMYQAAASLRAEMERKDPESFLSAMELLSAYAEGKCGHSAPELGNASTDGLVKLTIGLKTAYFRMDDDAVWSYYDQAIAAFDSVKA